ncbi:hypothetical protein B0T25DRAFT_583581 [Lasiosphaeria hispida]|uniref:Actin-like ATPase domain-containing protein n=1 Tax=Lasiosphaeria hispida TaxID=260671 RepID=A0AAJ0HBB2_9PEZI|nr:hypothetical protein B0T25DRAFT_583581 [Lasiosphaeria hispida]
MARSSPIGNIYVGIDFGATHSSISYILRPPGSGDVEAFVPLPQDVRLHSFKRTPTVFDLDQHGNIVLDPGLISPSPIIWPKLALLHYDCRPAGPLATQLAQKAEASWAGRPPAKMIAPFLKVLFVRLLQQLAEENVQIAGYEFYCTVTSPESWKLEDRERMKAAVGEANLASLVPGPNFSFYYISEQEAVALSVYNAGWADFFEEESLITVCDGGGLTLVSNSPSSGVPPGFLTASPIKDTASYVCGFYDGLPAMSQCGQALSQAAGGMSLNAGLDELVRQQLDRQTGKSNFLDTFSSAEKRAIEKQCSKVINSHGKPDSSELHILAERFNITIRREEINGIFDGLVNDLVGAVYSRLRNAEAAYPPLTARTALPKRYVILTGGLSCNHYIRNAMKDRVWVLDGHPIKLIIPDEEWGWLAVSRGGAIHAMQKTLNRPALKRRTCPATYYVKEGNTGNRTILAQERSTLERFSEGIGFLSMSPEISGAV